MPATESTSSRPSQLSSRSIALRSRWPAGFSLPSRRAASRPGIETTSVCIASKPSRSCSSSATQQLFDPLRAEAVVPLAGDVVRVLVADDAVVGGDEEAALGVDDLGQLLVGDRPLPLELSRPARLRQVRAAALAQRQAADQLVADRVVGRPRSGSRRAPCGPRAADQLRAGVDAVQVEHRRRRRSARRASASAGRAARRRRRRAPR